MIWGILASFLPDPFAYRSMFCCYYLVMSFVGCFSIMSFQPMPFIDAMFLSVSSLTCTGLTTVPTNAIYGASFGIMSVLMILGCTPTMLLPSLLYRSCCYDRLTAHIAKSRDSGALPMLENLSKSEQLIVDEYKVIGCSIRIMIGVVFAYIFLCLVGVGALVFLALKFTPSQHELVARHVTDFDNSVFLTISAYSNGGFTLTSDSTIGLISNNAVLVLLAFLIICGNTGIPIFLRYGVYLLYRCSVWWHGRGQSLSLYQRGLVMILKHPRRVTTYIFDVAQTKFLTMITATLYIIIAIFFVASCATKPLFTNQYSTSQLLTIAYFQSIATRSAGFAMVNFKDLNQGMLIVYVVMFYIAPAPFFSTMKSTNEAVVQSQQGLPVVGNREASIVSHADHVKEKEIYKGFFNDHLLKHSFFLLGSLIVLGFFEDPLIVADENLANVFFFVFELFSAYGNVGLSVGYPGVSYSLSGKMSVIGKLVICFVMILGKFRGLPDNDDEVIDFTFARLRRATRLDEGVVYTENPMLEHHGSGDEKADKFV